MTWICPKCERELKSQNQWHNCVKVSIDSLFAGKKDDLLLVFDKLLAVVADWDDLTMGATQNCIVFVHRQTFLIIKPMSKALNLKFYSATHQEGYPVLKSIACPGRFENHIRVSDVSDLTPVVFNYIRASYLLL